MKQVLEILSSETRAGIGSKSQKAYSMVICQCVVRDAEDNSIKVGELTMPKDAAEPLPGHYVATFKIGVDYRDKKIGGILVSIEPYIAPVEVIKPARTGFPPEGKPASSL